MSQGFFIFTRKGKSNVRVMALVRNSTANSYRLLETLQRVVPGKDLAVFRSLRALKLGLSTPGAHPEAVVLLARTREDLDSIGLLRTFLSDTRSILVLPDLAEDTLTEAHKLFPCFLSHIESDFSDLAAVLMKILTMRKPALPDYRESDQLKVIAIRKQGGRR